MKTLEQDPIDANVRCECSLHEDVTSRRDQEAWDGSVKGKNRLWHREMQDWYRGDENHSVAGTV